MNNALGDRLLGLALLVFAVAWTVIVVETIPSGSSGPVGPRGFPLGLGVLLAGLSGLLILGSFTRDADPDATPETDEPQPKSLTLGVEVWAVASTVGLLVVYTLLLSYTGFIIGTALTVAAGLLLVLKTPGWRLLLGMSLGMSLGIYLIFGKLLGVYLPHGSWVDIYF